MTKTLIIMSHPDVAQSSSQQFLLASIKGEEQIQIRHLESILAEQESNHFDKRIERACLQEADRIIFQFPFYWYQCPSVMKQWMDEVLTLNLSQKNKRAKRDRVDISKLSDKGSLKRAFGFSEPVVVLYVFAGSAYGPDSAQSA